MARFSFFLAPLIVIGLLSTIQCIDDSFTSPATLPEAGDMKLVLKDPAHKAIVLLNSTHPAHLILTKMYTDRSGNKELTGHSLNDLDTLRILSVNEIEDSATAGIIMADAKPKEKQAPPDPKPVITSYSNKYDPRHQNKAAPPPLPHEDLTDLVHIKTGSPKFSNKRNPPTDVQSDTLNKNTDGKLVIMDQKNVKSDTNEKSNLSSSNVKSGTNETTQNVSSSPSEKSGTPPVLDPCLVCDCKQSTSLLNCNNRNINTNYSRLLSSPLLSYKYSSLCLSNNNIKSLVQLPRMEQISRLCLSHNKIQIMQDGAFKHLPNLISLDLSFNQLNNFVLTPNVFQGNYAPDYYEPLKSLKILNLSHNDLHSLHADLFEHLPNLEELFLNFNPLGVIDMPTSIALSSMPYLKVLDLSHTGLDVIPNHLLHTPRYLHTLNLAFNQFREVPEQLAQSYDLQVLILNGNPIQEIRSFPVLLKLHSLSLSYMPELTSLKANSLSNLISLEEFNCSHNSKLSSLHPSSLSRMVTGDDGITRTVVWPPLEKLVLSNNALQRLDGNFLARWDKLQVLDIRFNPWLCDCENQWLVSSLLPLLEANHPNYINGLKCREPIEMRNMNLLDLDHKNYHMRCLDVYNNRPEYDGVLLFIVLLIVILFIPFCINFIIYIRKRNHPTSTTCPNVHYSRAFYKPGRTSDASHVISTHYIL